MRIEIKKGMRSIVAAAAAVALGFTMAACGSSNDVSDTTKNGNSAETPTVSFMLDWTPNTNHIGLYVAQKLGYYKDAGVNVKILPTAQAGAESSVENGVANVGFTTLSNVAAFNAQGSSLKFVFDLTQKQVARWCALASRTDIKTPKDLSGKTFVSFGSAEQSAVVSQMIKYAGGTGEFKTATAGTNTFETLTSGKGDFAGFYATWEGVESELNGPALNCFVASDWGVPGNPDQLGFAVKDSWLKDSKNADALKKFLAATKKGYDYALAHPDDAADILVDSAKEAQIDPKLAKASMKLIVDQNIWTTDDPKSMPGTVNFDEAQPYLDFQYKAGTYKDADGNDPAEAPQAKDLATNEYVA
ncbi:ABC transporter substrate-binding protein [Bifidobacterium simiiventris]|uniref:ABC transporter substrate-binding protein n=1 Tax=Bifidobacterium simiiventris TaxID=2834434 RepID=UPI001C598328|nr:ABC transporter substrate-binding protein [Bifidobacterium simiiventris]MBW3078469.1 ABC transporter substrate-binding protein [Bifidobacterium simiiventris]